MKKISIDKLADFYSASVLQNESFSYFLIKKLKSQWKSFYGPPDFLLYTKFYEFVAIETLFLQYQSTKSNAVLDKFIAALYRRPRFSIHKMNDKRQPLYGYDIEKNRKYIEKIPGEIKELIAYNYISVRSAIALKYSHIFQKGGDKINVQVWKDIRNAITDDWDFDKIDNAALSDILSKINHQMKKQ